MLKKHTLNIQRSNYLLFLWISIKEKFNYVIEFFSKENFKQTVLKVE